MKQVMFPSHFFMMFKNKEAGIKKFPIDSIDDILFSNILLSIEKYPLEPFITISLSNTLINQLLYKHFLVVLLNFFYQ